MSNTAELRRIHTRMCELEEAFFAIPERERYDGPKDRPIRAKLFALKERAEALCPDPELPPGFRWGHGPQDGEVAYGFRVLPDHAAPVESWGMVVTFEDANEVLRPFGLEARGNCFNDFFLIQIGKNDLRYAGTRVRLIGPQGQFEQVAHLFTKPERRPDHARV